MSSEEHKNTLSVEKNDRASMLKSRFADLIFKSQQTLANAHKKKVAGSDLDQAVPWRECYSLEPKKIKKTVSSCSDQVCDKRQREACFDDGLGIKKRPKTIARRDPSKTRNRSSGDKKIKAENKGADQDLKRRTEIERQREVARVAIENIKPTDLGLDNLSVMVEFEKLLNKKDVSHESKRREEIERQREAARMAMNNMKPTCFDLDNLGAMIELQRLMSS